MKVTVVTPCLNRADTIADCLESVEGQTYPDIEHIVVDGGSTDGTCDVVRGYPHVARLLSEPDRGLYDAINKGIALGSGDVVGILNSDDFYADAGVVERLVQALDESGCDGVFSDVAFIRLDPSPRIVRRYSSAGFTPPALLGGLMPAHPTFYVRSEAYRDYGLYRLDYKISADYEMMIRLFLGAGVTAQYVPGVAVYMRQGGASNSGLRSRWVLNEEILRGFRDNGIKPSRARLTRRYLRKALEYVNPPQVGSDAGSSIEAPASISWMRG